MQWLVLQGSFFVISVFLQQVRGYSAIQTGLMLTAGHDRHPGLVGGRASGWPAGTRSALLIRAGFMVDRRRPRPAARAGPRTSPSIWTFVPGLLLIGFGVGVMLTASVNVVQSAWPERDQGDISGVSRSVSNLGSSLGVAIAGSVLVGASVPGGKPFALALATMGVFVLLGLLAAVFIPTQPPATTAEAEAEQSAS